MQNLEIELRPSRILFLILMLLYIGAMICLFLADLSWCICLFGSLLLTISFLLTIKQHQQWQKLCWHGKTGWSVKRQDRWLTGVLKGSSLRTPVLTILNFRIKSFPYLISLVLFPDTMSKVWYRRLTVFLLSARRRAYEKS